MAKFSEQLFKLRTDKKLTQAELGKIFNLSKQTISGYETGGSTPTIDNVQNFADFFNVSTDYLLGRTDDIMPITKSAMPSEDIKTLEKIKNLSPVKRKAIEMLIYEDEEEIKSKHG